jgi:curved DNA-binding protein CbpA
MANPYETLGLSVDADDAAVRAKYLQLTREFPPESHPDKSATIREAYERLKDLNARAVDRLFNAAKLESLDSILEEVRCQRPKRRITLNELFRMAEISGR